MSVYARFKKNPNGFRALVELLESTPASRRQKMIDVGMAEDAEYTEKAISYMMTFQDVMSMPDLELAEVLAKAPARFVAYALHDSSEEQKTRWIKLAPPRASAEIRDYLNIKIGPREVGGGQMKVIETARQLEKAGMVRTKQIPIKP